MKHFLWLGVIAAVVLSAGQAQAVGGIWRWFGVGWGPGLHSSGDCPRHAHTAGPFGHGYLEPTLWPDFAPPLEAPPRPEEELLPPPPPVPAAAFRPPGARSLQSVSNRRQQPTPQAAVACPAEALPRGWELQSVMVP